MAQQAAFTCQTAIAEAKRQLCVLYPPNCTLTDQQVVDKIRSECTLFTGAEGQLIRMAIFGTTQCPTNAPSCLQAPTRYNCVSGQCVASATGTYATLAECQAACGAGGGGGNAMLWLAVGAVALLAVAVVATQPTSKKILVAKVQ